MKKISYQDLWQEFQGKFPGVHKIFFDELLKGIPVINTSEERRLSVFQVFKVCFIEGIKGVDGIMKALMELEKVAEKQIITRKGEIRSLETGKWE